MVKPAQRMRLGLHHQFPEQSSVSGAVRGANRRMCRGVAVPQQSWLRVLDHIPHAARKPFDLLQRSNRLLIVGFGFQQHQLGLGQHRCQWVCQIVSQPADALLGVVVHFATDR